jgi:lipoprotein-anchoring transpeptidase ErfK/SrfK
LSQRTLEVREGHAVLAQFPIAVGKAGHSTPRGTFTINKIIWNPRWVPPDSPWAKGRKPKPPGDPDNPMQGVKLFFREPTYYIHGTNDEASIGRAASHGCIRMTPADAAQVARWVMERGGEPRPESWFRSVRRAFTQEHVIELANPVVLHITS